MKRTLVATALGLALLISIALGQSKSMRVAFRTVKGEPSRYITASGGSATIANFACENCSGFWGCAKCYAGRAWYSGTARQSGNESQTPPKIDDCFRGFILGKHGKESPKSINDALIKKWLDEAKKVCEDPNNK